MEDSNTLLPSESVSDSNNRLTILIGVILFVVAVILRISFLVWKSAARRMIRKWQKTREPQRRMYVGSRGRPSLGQQPPTIFVSPANLPPPPKYESMAPPSYEEVVGVHYPTFQPPFSRAIAVQPITQPITEAVAHSSNATNDVAPGTNVYAPTTVTIVSEERRPSVNLANNR